MGKLWGGRFRKDLDESAKDYSYSLDVDSRLVQYDIRVNKAQAGALKKSGVFSDSEYTTVISCLEDLSIAFEEDPIVLLADDEDIHSCIERLVTEQLGDLGKKLHTGKSRNDQVVTDVRMFVKDEILRIREAFTDILDALYKLAKSELGTPFPGFTHLQTAQPVLLSHHILAYFEMLTRDVERFDDTYIRTDVCPLGAAALAGNNYNLDREQIAAELGFTAITQNSMDAVADRDFMLEFLTNASITMTHLSRLAEELILWSSPLTGFVTIGDDFTTGSSIMPQKKNPDIAELLRGKTGRVHGNMTALFHLIKGLPLTYNRDLQEDKELLFDTVDTLYMSLHVTAKMLATLEFHRDKIDAALGDGHALATELADYLVKKGLAFRDAHEITGAVVLYADQNKKRLDELDLGEFHSIDKRFESDVMDVLTVSAAIDAKSVVGGTATARVKEQLNRAKKIISELEGDE